jgi:hypothetical protein
MKRIGALVVLASLPIIVGVALGAVSHRSHKRPAPKAMLLGNGRVASEVAHAPADSAEVFPFTARTNGTATSIRIYVDRRSRSTRLLTGIYLYRHGHPGRRLRYVKLSRPHAGRWNSVKISSLGIRSGRRYGIAVLGVGGPLSFRYRTGSTCRQTESDQISARALPASWHGGRRRSTCAISADVVGRIRRTGGAKPTPHPVAPAPVASGGVVGTSGEPAVTCTTTLNPGADVQQALATASPGGVVCLNAGSWPGLTISGLTPAAPGVTLAATPGAAVSMAGITTTGQANNLTIEGIRFTQNFALQAGASNITLQYNNFQYLSGQYAIYSYPLSSGGPGSVVNGVRVLYNQIDHVGNCMEIDSTGTPQSQSNWTFSHNVCGPDIGYNGSSGAHYIQAECLNGFTLTNNAFEGPFDASDEADPDANHINVLHTCGNNITFDNNLLWHVQAVAQAVLVGDDGSTNGFTAENNLDVQDPSCDPRTDVSCTSVTFWQEANGGATNILFSNNTMENDGTPRSDNVDGGIWVNNAATNVTGTNNLAVTHGNEGDYAFPNSCSCTGNVSGDGNGNIKNWKPVWQNTNWTPNDGVPWRAPPANYYKPANLGSKVGYQGALGP